MKKLAIVILSAFFVSIFFVIHLSAKERAIMVKLRESERPNAPVVAEVDLYSRSYALVIGIGSYTDKAWPRLSGAIHDAELVADVLREKGFEVTFKTNLNSRELKQAFEEFFIFKGDDPNARLFVWFAGHGHSLDGEGFLIPADAPRPQAGAKFKFKALSMRRFGEYVRLAKSKHALAVFDSCFSGTIFDTQRTTPPPAVTRATTLPVRQFLSSGDSNQKVSDDGRFRKLFMRAIKGEEKADANSDGYLTGTELGLFLTDRLTNLTESRQTPRYGKLRDEDWDRGDFVFQLASSSGVTIEERTTKAVKTVLKVICNVEGSSVVVDGVGKGITPVNLAGIKPGRHRIKIMREGYESYEERVYLRQGKTLTVKAILWRLSGTLEVTGNPAGAKVYLDGYYIGVIPLDPTQVQPGSHQVKVIRKGFDELDKAINVEASKAVRLKVDLKSIGMPKTFTNSIGMRFVKTPSGSFVMGSGISVSESVSQFGFADEMEMYKAEHPQHRVTISKPFYLQATEVTQEQWERVMGSNPSHFKNCGANCPVECVSWNDTQAFIRALNQMEGTEKYRLPSEAEWEYACRAGTKTIFSWGNEPDCSKTNYGAVTALDCDGVNPGRTMKAGIFPPNPWGLYDMHGNVGEWCEDWFGDYPSGSVTDPTGPSSGSYRVSRGGSFGSSVSLCRSAFRTRSGPGSSNAFAGFRLARNP